MSAHDNNETLEEKWTLEYRQAASSLASAFIRKTRMDLKRQLQNERDDSEESVSSYWCRIRDELPSMRTAHYMLSNHPGWIPSRLVVEAEDDDSFSTLMQDGDKSPHSGKNHDPNTTKNENEKEIYLPCCPHCGGPLQPGLQGTTIRLKPKEKSMSRTQRRRLSRQKARLQAARKIEEKQVRAARAGANGKIQQSTSLSQLGAHVHWHFAPVTTTAGSSSVDRSIRHELASAKNCLQIRCACGGTTIMPGFPRNPRRSLQKSQKEQQGTKLPQLAASLDPKEEFVSVAKVVSTGAEEGSKPGNNKKRKSQQQAMVSSLSNRKMNRKSTNQLMDFLSSLNDH